ncbi:MFS transporter [Acidomonas methanolica]|uniref:MFS transporter n=1 Tax=Acidomonas methanolica TaxID=437 RepID=UPI00211A672E|nr:MFS transporter [Acidomonas methanolica]MCQ9156667.1 MFS transporter [Acidomonas methanolica]
MNRAGRATVVLLFLIAIVSYADRQILALLKPVLDRRFGWSPEDYGRIAAWSQAATAVSLLASGWVVDRLGVRFTLGAGLAGWSAMTMLHAWARTVAGFIAVRVGLGVFEGVGTPAMMKAVSTYIPPRRRAATLGLLNAAPNFAAMGTPLFVAAVFPALGWRGTIIAVGLAGFLCVIPWCLRRPEANAFPEERAPACAPSPLPARRLVLGFALGKFITDPVWWFLLFWLPDLLHRRFGLGPAQMGLPVATAYLMAAAGSLAGGHAPRALAARRGGRPEASRRIVMGVAALLVLPLPLSLVTDSLAVATLLCGLTLAAHQAFAANLFGFASEWISPKRIGRATGIGAFCGNVGGAVGLRLAGYAAGSAWGLAPVMIYGALAYGIAWLLFRLIAPPARFDGAPESLRTPARASSPRGSPAR